LGFAVASDAENIFNNSSHSLSNGSSNFFRTSSASIGNSNQKSVSSVSSATALILEMKSGAERAPQAAR
jgi:hypothetical protein